MGVPISKVYRKIAAIVYEDGTLSPSSSPAQCVDDPSFTSLVGYDFTDCDWFAEDPSYNCGQFGGGTWKDEDGDTANKVSSSLVFYFEKD